MRANTAATNVSGMISESENSESASLASPKSTTKTQRTAIHNFVFLIFDPRLQLIDDSTRRASAHTVPVSRVVAAPRDVAASSGGPNLIRLGEATARSPQKARRRDLTFTQRADASVHLAVQLGKEGLGSLVETLRRGVRGKDCYVTRLGDAPISVP